MWFTIGKPEGLDKKKRLAANRLSTSGYELHFWLGYFILFAHVVYIGELFSFFDVLGK